MPFAFASLDDARRSSNNNNEDIMTSNEDKETYLGYFLAHIAVLFNFKLSLREAAERSKCQGGRERVVSQSYEPLAPNNQTFRVLPYNKTNK